MKNFNLNEISAKRIYLKNHIFEFSLCFIKLNDVYTNNTF